MLTAPITTTKVANQLGTSSHDVGTLCTNSNINMWAKYKPVSYATNTGITDSQRKSVNYGIQFTKITSITQLGSNGVQDNSTKAKYIRPTGGSSSPYRLGDFRNYDHAARVPLQTWWQQEGGDINEGTRITCGFTPVTTPGSTGEISWSEILAIFGGVNVYPAIVLKNRRTSEQVMWSLGTPLSNSVAEDTIINIDWGVDDPLSDEGGFGLDVQYGLEAGGGGDLVDAYLLLVDTPHATSMTNITCYSPIMSDDMVVHTQFKSFGPATERVEVNINISAFNITTYNNSGNSTWYVRDDATACIYSFKKYLYRLVVNFTTSNAGYMDTYLTGEGQKTTTPSYTADNLPKSYLIEENENGTTHNITYNFNTERFTYYETLANAQNQIEPRTSSGCPIYSGVAARIGYTSTEVGDYTVNNLFLAFNIHSDDPYTQYYVTQSGTTQVSVL